MIQFSRLILLPKSLIPARVENPAEVRKTYNFREHITDKNLRKNRDNNENKWCSYR